MKTILVTLLLALASPAITAPVLGADIAGSFVNSREGVKQALQKVVQSQLAAFRRGDFTRAYSYASSGIRKQLPQHKFAQMVRASYPAIASSVSVKFGPILDDGNAAVVHAMVVGAGKQTLYAYRLVRERGNWKIDGVIEAPLPPVEGAIST